jgi:hypothetical protein
MKLKSSRAGVGIHALVASFLVVGCTSEAVGPEVEAQGAEAVVVGAGVVQVTASDVEDAVIGVDSMTFFEPNERLMRIGKGTLVMGILKGEPFIRRVRSVDFQVDGSLYFTTDLAGVADVAPTAQARRSVEFDPLVFDKSDLVIAQGAGTNLSCTKCTVQFAPTLDYQFDLRAGAPESIGVGVRGKLEGDLELTLEAGNGGGSLKKEVEIAKASQRLVQTLGPVPIWEDLSVSLVAGVEGKLDSRATIVTKIHTEKEASFGAYMSHDEWTFEKDEKDAKFVYEHPVLRTQVGASAAVYVKLRVAASVYSIAQAYLDAEARAEARLTVCPSPSKGSLDGSLGIVAGAKLVLPLVKDPEISKDLVRVTQSKSVPLPSPVVVKCP